MKARPELLARYVLPASEAPRFPLDWHAVFGRSAPLVAELGFGNGEYLAWDAARRPDHDFVGIELPLQCFLRAASNLGRAGVGNARLVRGDGRYLLRELFAGASLRAVLLQFPMPWPKERHAKHRVTGSRLAETLAGVLEPGGAFELVTDQEWFAQAAYADFAADAAFTVDPLEAATERAFLTRYERRWTAAGRRIHRLVARLRTPRACERLCREGNMHASRLKTAPSEAAVAALAGARFAGEREVGEVKEVLRARDGWLLRVVTADDSFTQFFFLRLLANPDGSALLRVEEQPRPYPTPAVRHLVEALALALDRPAG
ncbi:MAG: hypothetical protein EYC70_12010 [Planctomycetota bacterium]|nr:MAG: hypothetical protein EYC70_12010 [Planctomycetota bacterium]